ARRSLFHWCVKSAFDLENIVLIEAMDLNDGARRIGSLAPKLLLHLVHQRAKAKHVGHVHDDAHTVAQARALRFGDHLHVLRKPWRMRASSPGTNVFVLGSIRRMPAI